MALLLTVALYPHIQKIAMTPEKAFARKGGSRFVLEAGGTGVEGAQFEKDMDRVCDVVRNRLDHLNAYEPLVERDGARRIVVRLADFRDLERARKLIESTATLDWYLVRRQYEIADVVKDLDAIFGKADIDSLGRIMPGIEAMDHNKPFTSLLLSFYRDWLIIDVRNVPLVQWMLAQPEARDAVPRNSQFMWCDVWMPLPDGGRARYLFLVATDERVSGANLVGAMVLSNGKGGDKAKVSFEFNERGAEEFKKFTGNNVGRYTAIVLDGNIRSYPIIKVELPHGKGVIEGDFGDIEASDLAVLMKANALPLPVTIVEEGIMEPDG
jgi:SecD/SecF fusion protein